MKTMDLSGIWSMWLDPDKKGYDKAQWETMALPGTTSYCKKGIPNEARETYFLTDAYFYEGWVWFEREIQVNEPIEGDCILFLERTRMTQVYIDGQLVGREDSLSTPHEYLVTPYLSPGSHTLTIRVDNTDYPTKGGHLTSKDTQSNWNGITGKIELQFLEKKRLVDVRIYPDGHKKCFCLTGKLVGAESTTLEVAYKGQDMEAWYVQPSVTLEKENFEFTIDMGPDAILWSEFNPYLYTLRLQVFGGGCHEYQVGLRSFEAGERHFTINGFKTYLRGKHDGLIFPRTGFAPTDVDSWLEVMKTARAYGINHYRFHTCCPPEAAFEAADRVGIYMEPELPFWGTIYSREDEHFNAVEHDYLVTEGYKILETYANHPSFVMMSLGNELWGDHDTIDGMLANYKAFDNRPLYTQGSNNFQFVPVVLPHEDFFSGVRFDRDRLIRGSYAMCDAPQGHIQTQAPSTKRDYDSCFVDDKEQEDLIQEGSVEIQFGTGVKQVEVSGDSGRFKPSLPVVSHEIGQYQTYPNYQEIDKYSGPLKARNFEVFQERLEAAGLSHMAQRYFEDSGHLAMACYKEEIEAAIRSQYMAGFQLLDIQDFSGQGTALVGVLDAFMESKGLISEKDWQSFCWDLVLLGRFDTYTYKSGETLRCQIQLAKYAPVQEDQDTLEWTLKSPNHQVDIGGTMTVGIPKTSGIIDFGSLEVVMPQVSDMTEVTLTMSLKGLDIYKTYTFWIFPEAVTSLEDHADCITESWQEAKDWLDQGRSVIYLPQAEDIVESIEGTYCTDFWCYPMFRSISESMNKPLPIGTLGLSIEADHAALDGFVTDTYSTPQWYDLVTGSRALIIDKLPKDCQPVVSVIDNFERNHRLSMLMECRVAQGKLIILSVAKETLMTSMSGKALAGSLVTYVESPEFAPKAVVDAVNLDQLFKTV